jgi:hypothetical protein
LLYKLLLWFIFISLETQTDVSSETADLLQEAKNVLDLPAQVVAEKPLAT